jgi:hypothetical protein
MSHARRPCGVVIAAAMAVLFALTACDRAHEADVAAKPAAATAPPPEPTPLAPAATQPARSGDFVLPGAFAPDTTVADLESRFGKANVRVGDLPGAEGEVHRGVELFAGDASRQAYVYFQDEQALRGLSRVAVGNDGSRWTLDNGVRIGMPLADLVALNGAAVIFTGFDWDYGGYVSDWSDGKLDPAEGDPVRRGVRLRVRESARSAAQPAAYPVGDSEFRSDEADFPKLGELAEVGDISVSFPGEDDL